MSVQAMSWVLDHSNSRLAARLVLLSIANHANDHGESAWPHIITIAREAHVSERQAQRAIQELVTMQELFVWLEAGPRRSNVYQVLMKGDKLSPSRVTNPTREGDKSDGAIRKNRPEPSKPNPPTPLKKGGVRLTGRLLQKINTEIQRRQGAWEGLPAHERDERVDAICIHAGVDPDEYRERVQWPRVPRPEWADEKELGAEVRRLLGVETKSGGNNDAET